MQTQLLMANWYLTSINKLSIIKSLSYPITWLNCKFSGMLCNLFNKILCKSCLVHFVILDWPLFLFQGYNWLALIIINFLRNVSSPWVIRFFIKWTSYSCFFYLYFLTYCHYQNLREKSWGNFWQLKRKINRFLVKFWNQIKWCYLYTTRWLQ